MLNSNIRNNVNKRAQVAHATPQHALANDATTGAEVRTAMTAYQLHSVCLLECHLRLLSLTWMSIFLLASLAQVPAVEASILGSQILLVILHMHQLSQLY